jgi:hypothetical protein
MTESKRFPPLERGQLPSRQHFNTVSKHSQDFGALSLGTTPGINWPFVAFGDQMQLHLFIFEITDLTIDGSDLDSSGLYLGKIKWFNHDSNAWDDSEPNPKEWIMDERGITSPATYDVGDKVTVYWDAQRGTFVPVTGGEEITVVTDFQVDTSNNKLQMKTRTVNLFPTGDESDWIDVHTGTDCPT